MAIKIIGNTLSEKDCNYKKIYNVFTKLERRFQRFSRLVNLGAPAIIIRNESYWILTYVDHLDKLMHGFEQAYTKEELEELE